jgi:Tfp pilus assembly protein PilN
MRPVNLIPQDERRTRTSGSARAGLLSYFVLGALGAVLLGVTVLVLTSNQISERKAEIAQLEQERDATQARAESLRAFADFSSMEEERTATVKALAQSRFDWERVLRELSLVLPENVWLTELEGSVAPDVELEDSVDIETRSSVDGPALELIGCTVSQEAVGAFAATLGEIDGVTRVSVANSERPEQSTGGEGSGSGETDCRTRDFITRFEIVAAFDAVPEPIGADPAAPAPAPTTAAPPAGEQSPAPSTGTKGTQQASDTAPGS